MSDPREIYLQPECCADPEVGRLWCEDDAPVDCEDGKPWTKYILADRYDEALALLKHLKARTADPELLARIDALLQQGK